MLRVKNVHESVCEFYDACHTQDFCKTKKLNELGERALLPLLKAFFFGRFGWIRPEVKVTDGRVDFVIDTISVEIVVRKPNAPAAALSTSVNAPEIRKLLRYNEGTALLILLDFSKSPFTEDRLDRFRDWPSLGRGRHRVSAFNVSYHFRNHDRISSSILKNIRV